MKGVRGGLVSISEKKNNLCVCAGKQEVSGQKEAVGSL